MELYATRDIPQAKNHIRFEVYKDGYQTFVKRWRRKYSKGRETGIAVDEWTCPTMDAEHWVNFNDGRLMYKDCPWVRA